MNLALMTQVSKKVKRVKLGDTEFSVAVDDFFKINGQFFRQVNWGHFTNRYPFCVDIHIKIKIGKIPAAFSVKFFQQITGYSRPKLVLKVDTSLFLRVISVFGV